MSAAQVQKHMDEETAMISEMKEIVETDERRNDLETYIYNIRDKTSESGEYGAFIANDEREQFHQNLTKAEDWLYDAENPTKAEYIDKLDGLKTVGDPVVWRCKESSIRDEWIQAVSGTINNYRAAAENPGDKYGHIDKDKLNNVVVACNDLEKWLTEMKAKQSTLPKTTRPVLICADMEKKNQDLAKMANEILSAPKPAPPPEKKAEEKAYEESKEGGEGNGVAPKADGEDAVEGNGMDVE